MRLKDNLLEEVVNDDIDNLNSMVEHDSKVGHKSADTSFFGYKPHIVMVPGTIITAVVVTTEDKHDGKQLKDLVEKSRENGIKVDVFIGDDAYSEKENIEYVKEDKFNLIWLCSR